MPLGLILKMHRERYKFESSLGTFLLRRLTQLDLEMTVTRVSAAHPEYKRLSDEGMQLVEDLRAGRPFAGGASETRRDRREAHAIHARVRR